MNDLLHNHISNFVDVLFRHVTDEIEKQCVAKIGLSLEEYAKIEMKIHHDRVFNSQIRQQFNRLYQIEKLLKKQPLLDLDFTIDSDTNDILTDLRITSRSHPVFINEVLLQDDVTCSPVKKEIFKNLGLTNVTGELANSPGVKIIPKQKFVRPNIKIGCTYDDYFYEITYIFEDDYFYPTVYFDTEDYLIEETNKLRSVLGFEPVKNRLYLIGVRNEEGNFSVHYNHMEDDDDE